MAAIEAVLIGAGQRGIDAIGAFAKSFPDELKFVAVAEVDKGLAVVREGSPDR